jgi:hypothetical protein
MLPSFHKLTELLVRLWPGQTFSRSTYVAQAIKAFKVSRYQTGPSRQTNSSDMADQTSPTFASGMADQTGPIGPTNPSAMADQINQPDKPAWQQAFQTRFSKAAQQWWRCLAEHPGLGNVIFDQPGRSEIVDECLTMLHRLETKKLVGRNNRCILGARRIGKTCLFKSLVCLNSVLSANTVSIYVDHTVKNLSSVIVDSLCARYELMDKAVLLADKHFGPNWTDSIEKVLRFLELTEKRAFVVLDNIDSLYAREAGSNNVLRQLVMLGENTRYVLVYLVGTSSKARVLVTARLAGPERAKYPCYTGVSLNNTKYVFRVQRALQLDRQGFQSLLGQKAVACELSELSKLYVGFGGQFGSDQMSSKLQAVKKNSPAWCCLSAFWHVLVSTRPWLLTHFHGDAFCVFGNDQLELDLAHVVGFAAKAGHQVDKSVLYELSDQGMLYFDDQRWSARLSLVHACHIAAFEAVDW